MTAVPELGTSVFLVPSECVKNREHRLVVLNRVAKSAVDGMRGGHKDHVSTCRGNALFQMNNTAWQHARERVGYPPSGA